MPIEKKSASGGERGGGEGGRGHLDHDADLERGSRARAVDLLAGALDERPGGRELLGRRDHREHHAHGVVGGHAQQRPQLREQQVGAREPEPDAPHPEERVLLAGLAEGRDGLVGPRVEGAHEQRPPLERLGGGAVGGLLLVLVGQRGRDP